MKKAEMDKQFKTEMENMTAVATGQKPRKPMKPSNDQMKANDKKLLETIHKKEQAQLKAIKIKAAA